MRFVSSFWNQFYKTIRFQRFFRWPLPLIYKIVAVTSFVCRVYDTQNARKWFPLVTQISLSTLELFGNQIYPAGWCSRLLLATITASPIEDERVCWLRLWRSSEFSIDFFIVASCFNVKWIGINFHCVVLVGSVNGLVVLWTFLLTSKVLQGQCFLASSVSAPISTAYFSILSSSCTSFLTWPIGDMFPPTLCPLRLHGIPIGHP